MGTDGRARLPVPVRRDEKSAGVAESVSFSPGSALKPSKSSRFPLQIPRTRLPGAESRCYRASARNGVSGIRLNHLCHS
jgi:hypothetical protein